MSATSVRLLEVAAEIAGGEKALAHRLGIDDAVLDAYLGDRRPLPDRLLLRTVDLILAERMSRVALPAASARASAEEAIRDG